jgi:hypothetical protein
MSIRVFLTNSFFLAAVYYSLFIASYMTLLSMIGRFYNADAPLMANLFALSWILMVPFASAILMGAFYTIVTHEKMPLKKRLRVAGLSSLVPLAFVATMILGALPAGTRGLLTGFDKIIVGAMLAIAFFVFASICCFAQLLGWAYLAVQKRKSHTHSPK